MPSPLKGLMDPAASPTTTTLGPVRGPTPSPMGSFPPVGVPHDVSGESPHDGGAKPTKVSINSVVLVPFQRPVTVSRPTPTLTRPSPMGKIQPYPGTTAPASLRMSR